ncbi:MAG: hypothetical protein AAGD06_24300 [Acidobacteriota bacterium]
MSLEYIRNYYRVPAHRGVRVTYDGRPGVVTGSHVLVRLDGESASKPYHPSSLKWAEVPS